MQMPSLAEYRMPAARFEYGARNVPERRGVTVGTPKRDNQIRLTVHANHANAATIMLRLADHRGVTVSQGIAPKVLNAALCNPHLDQWSDATHRRRPEASERVRGVRINPSLRRH